MKIAFDCRYFGNSGIGRVNEGILEDLLANDGHGHQWVLIGDPTKLAKFVPLGEILAENSNPFSKSGLFFEKTALNKINACDAFLSVGYVFPFGIKIPLYLFIHDCVFFDKKETTNGFVDLQIKRYFYKRAVKKSRRIFTVSEFSKGRIVSLFKADPEKITVVLNGVAPAVLSFPKAKRKNQNFIFVGNFKSHKGIDVLLAAYTSYRKEGGTMSLTIVGNQDNLRTAYRFRDEERDLEGVSFLEKPDDETLLAAMASASALIQPSRYEGFGLPPIEALCLGTNVILSDIPVFKEIYGNMDVVFFHDGDSEDLKDKMLEFQAKPLEDFHLPENVSFAAMGRTICQLIQEGR